MRRAPAARRRCALSTISNPSPPDRRKRFRGNAFDHRERGRLGGKPGEEPLHAGGRPLDLDLHAALVVEHVAGEPLLAGQSVDVGPEPHALDDTVHAHARASNAQSSISSRRTCHALACASWIRGMCSERVTTTWSASRSSATRPPS